MLDYTEFQALSQDYNLIPLFRELIVDTETPVSLYRRLSRADDYSFLLESNSSGGDSNRGRYSFIGLYPLRVVKKTDSRVMVIDDRGETRLNDSGLGLVDYLNNYLDQIKVWKSPELPPFSGGFVGYFGYEMAGEWEQLYHNQAGQGLKQRNYPGTILVLPRVVIAYDHLKNTIKIIDNILLETEASSEEKKELYHQSQQRINNLVKLIRKSQFLSPGQDRDRPAGQGPRMGELELKPEVARTDFKQMVTRAREYIKQGEVFQLVLSQRFSLETELSPFQVYRALRVSNPSPYLFYLNFPEVKLIGSSPEILVKVTGDRVISRPLAGTRPRGKTPVQDGEYKEDLQADEKERAEHVMLVDLGRNDLGRVCQASSIEVTELMGVEYYSRVMHLVSQVEGTKKQELSALDVLKAVFPAGTVSGAPKIRAMELINELEQSARGAYAGAVGYLDFSGNLDTCITIRTFFYHRGVLSLQAGAGIVADSDPEKEYRETLNKGRALFEALSLARKEGLYGLGN